MIAGRWGGNRTGGRSQAYTSTHAHTQHAHTRSTPYLFPSMMRDARLQQLRLLCGVLGCCAAAAAAAGQLQLLRRSSLAEGGERDFTPVERRPAGGEG
eukprot:364388-Chlamydomonas_euryale.AAC.9